MPARGGPLTLLWKLDITLSAPLAKENPPEIVPWFSPYGPYGGFLKYRVYQIIHVIRPFVRIETHGFGDGPAAPMFDDNFGGWCNLVGWNHVLCFWNIISEHGFSGNDWKIFGFFMDSPWGFCNTNPSSWWIPKISKYSLPCEIDDDPRS